MKKLFTAFLVSASIAGYSQSENVGIGTTEPDKSAILDLSSSDKGLLIPRMTISQRNDILNPSQGLMVFQMDETSGFYFYDGDAWKPVSSVTEMNSIANDPNDWSFTGNSAPSGAFLGTTNNRALTFKVNNVQAGLVHNSNRNTYFGLNAGVSNVNGNDNVGLGSQALRANSDGDNNIAIGSKSLLANTSGLFNIAIGTSALISNLSSSNNVAIGTGALRNTVGSGGTGNNVAIGRDALSANTSGVENYAIGFQALESNVSGNSNFAIGREALGSLTSGTNNLALGNYAGLSTTGSNNIFLGFQAGRNEAGSDKLYIANSSTTTPLIYGDFSAKFVSIGDVDSGLKREDAVTSGGYKLLVEGGILTEKIKVALKSSGDWADYVFEPSYSLLSLEEVEKFTIENKHLPNVPSADEMAENGLEIAEASKMFMEKIEELTLYMIEMNKEIKVLKAQNALLLENR